MKKINGIEVHYSRTVKRTVIHGRITYCGRVYTSHELSDLADHTRINVTKFAEHPGEFDIGKLLVDPVGERKEHFWINQQIKG